MSVGVSGSKTSKRRLSSSKTAPPRTEARNQSLGKAGEELALRFERERLCHFERPRLAANIRHVSQIEGDHLGYDILSFEPDGRERLIEVKTTRFAALTPFFASRHEVEVSRQRHEQYQLYRVYRFSADAKLFALSGSLRNPASSSLSHIRRFRLNRQLGRLV